jgi:hypothetical protein
MILVKLFFSASISLSLSEFMCKKEQELPNKQLPYIVRYLHMMGCLFIQVSLSQTASKHMSLLWKFLQLEPNLQCPYLWNLQILASMFTSKGDFNTGLEDKTGD